MGMDSYRDSTSVGLRLASTLSSDRGQQQSINHHIFAMIKKIWEVHHKMKIHMCFLLEF